MGLKKIGREDVYWINLAQDWDMWKRNLSFAMHLVTIVALDEL
jgi:hypothetical protein